MLRTSPALIVGLCVIQTACPPPAPQQYSAQSSAGSQPAPPPPPPPPPAYAQPQQYPQQQPAFGTPQGPGLVFGVSGQPGFGSQPQAGSWGAQQPAYPQPQPQQPATGWGAQPQPATGWGAQPAYPQQPQQPATAWGAQPQPQPATGWGAQPAYPQQPQQPATGWGAQPQPQQPAPAWGAQPQPQPQQPATGWGAQPPVAPVAQQPVMPQPVAQQPAAPQVPANSALVRVIHASPDTMARAVAAYLDNSQTAAIPNLEYRSAAGYTPMPAGTHTVQARLAGMPASTPPALSWNTPAFLAGHAYTIIAHGIASEFGGNTPVTFSPEEDSLTAPAPGRTNIRFFHALVGGPAVDVCVNGTIPAFVSASYGTWANAFGTSTRYAAASPGAINVSLRASGGGAPCGGRVLGTVQTSLPDRSNLTVIAIGRSGRGTPEVLVCTDAPLTVPSQCVTAPVTGA